MASPRRALLALLAFVVILAACGGSDDPAAAPDSGSGDGFPLASETLSTVGGGQLAFGELEGTATVLWFWAPW